MPDSTAHEIRLAGPWQVDWVGPEDVPPDTIAVENSSFPVDWETLFGEVAGTARFTRRFNRPTGLSAETRVWLAIPDYCGMLSVELNQKVLAILPEEELPVRLDITHALALHNRLVLEVTSGPERCETEGHKRLPVRLEIVESP